MVALFPIGLFTLLICAGYPLYILIEAKIEGKTFREYWQEIEG